MAIANGLGGDTARSLGSEAVKGLVSMRLMVRPHAVPVMREQDGRAVSAQTTTRENRCFSLCHRVSSFPPPCLLLTSQVGNLTAEESTC